MNENEELVKKDTKAANIWTAILLGVFALLGALMPFFYLKDAIFPR